MQVHVASWWLLLILGYVAVKRNKGWPGSHLIFVVFNKHGEISANQATMAHEIAPLRNDQQRVTLLYRFYYYPPDLTAAGYSRSPFRLLVP